MTNDTTEGGEMMKVKTQIIGNGYEVASGGTVLEWIAFATAKMRKDNPTLAPRLNKDEARIYAKQRAEFYNTRLTK
jgi:hypothetical protein